MRPRSLSELASMNSERDYSKREVDMQFQALGDKVDENHQETKEQVALLSRRINDQNTEQMAHLTKIVEQTTKTNGRVTNLESWQTYIKGGVAVITVLMLPILFILISQYVENYGK